MSPTFNDRVQGQDELGLTRHLVAIYHLSDLLAMPLNRLFTGCDDGLEPQRELIAGVDTRLLFTDGELSDSKPQKVKPCYGFLIAKGVCDPRLAWFQFQAHPFELFRKDYLTLLDDLPIFV